MQTNNTNHVVFLLDSSGSMSGISTMVRKKFSELVKTVKDTLIPGEQTIVSFYTFDVPGEVKTLFENVDANYVNPSDVSSQYNATGASTALCQSAFDVINKAIDSSNRKNIESTLIYVVTDGHENSSPIQYKQSLPRLLRALPENVSVTVLVPNEPGRRQAISFGFDQGNIEVWDATSSRGVEEVTQTISRSYSNFKSARLSGSVGSKSLFVDASNLSKTDVKSALTEIDVDIFPIQTKTAQRIDEFVESKTGSYVLGTAFYELTKSELVQGHKKIIIRNRNTDKNYTGSEARKLLGIGFHDQRVRPGDFGEWRIFVQSTSLNRKLIPGQSVIVYNGGV